MRAIRAVDVLSRKRAHGCVIRCKQVQKVHVGLSGRFHDAMGQDRRHVGKARGSGAALARERKIVLDVKLAFDGF